MCIAVGTMVGCAGAGEADRDQEPRTPQYAEEETHHVAPSLREDGPPLWDGTPCNGTGTMIHYEGYSVLVPSECNPNYVEKGTPAAEVYPPTEMGWEI